jgi:adenylate cyclase
MGDSVNIASRLVAHAPAGEIFISQSTAAELGEKFQVVSLPALRLKGRKERVSIYRVEWHERPGKKKRRSSRSAKSTG